MSTALFAVSVPLVTWFFLRSVGFIANSMAGNKEFDRPRQWVANNIITVLALAPPTPPSFPHMGH